MRSTRSMVGAPVQFAPLAPRALLALLGLLACVCAAGAQDNPFELLKAYNWQDRRAGSAIDAMVRQAGQDRSKLAVIEQGLIGVLKDPATTEAGRQEACRILWVAGSARSVPVLARMLADANLGNFARYALERNTDPAAGAALRAATRSARGLALVGIVNSIGDRGDADAVPALAPLCKSSDAAVSEAAVTALGKIGSPSAVAVLRGLPSGDLTANRALLRCAARMAASRKADAERLYAGLAAEGRPLPTRVAAIVGLARMGSPKAGPLALAAMRSTHPYVQAGAARVCGTLSDAQVARQAVAAWPGLSRPAQIVLLSAWADRREARAAGVALQAARSPEADLRLAGVRAAPNVCGASAVPVLADLAAAREGDVRQAARAGLAGMGGAQAEEAILQTAQQGQPDVRSAMTDVLAERQTPGAVALLVKEARATDARLATDALHALQRAGGKDEYAGLVRLLVTTSDDGVRDAARGAVVAIAQRVGDRDAAVAPLLAEAAAATGASKAALIGALAEIGGERALAEIVKATSASDADVKQAAVSALADTWGDAGAMAPLLQIAKADSSRATQVVALRGYLRLLGQADQSPPAEKVARASDAIAVAIRPEEKRQALGVLRGCRTPEAVAAAAKLLDDAEVFADAADTVIYLATPQRKDNVDLAAVTGPATSAALDRIVQGATDADLKARAEKAKG